MKQLTVVVKPFRAEAVLRAVAELGVTSCVVREAKGYSRQKGYVDRYAGSEYSMAFLPKVEISVCVADESFVGRHDLARRRVSLSSWQRRSPKRRQALTCCARPCQNRLCHLPQPSGTHRPRKSRRSSSVVSSTAAPFGAPASWGTLSLVSLSPASSHTRRKGPGHPGLSGRPGG
jgi:nitrogen regulatory protein P-II 2